MSRMTKLLMAAIAVLLIVAPFSYAGPSSDNSGGNNQGTAPRPTSAPSTPAAPAAPRSPYFTGDGGSGMSLAVLVPSAQGIAADQNYLPTMVQGVLVSDLAKYSAVSVLDRLRLETVLRETESGIYKNEADYGRLGQIANVDYALTGSITRTGSGYAMQIQVVGTGTNTIGVTKAAYSGTCTIAEFDNFTGIRKASLELLTQMGVALTDQARQELSAASSAQTVSSQTALAQGITSQRGGTVVDALSHYIQANNYDPSSAEAASRLNILSTNISSGNIGENVRNDIAWRRQWADRLREAESYFINYTRDPPPFYLVYSTDIKQGAVNYQNETVSLSIRMSAIHDAPYFITVNRVMRTVRMGLIATGRIREWNLDWPQTAVQTALPRERKGNYSVVVEIVNSEGRSLGRQTVSLGYGWERSAGNISLLSDSYLGRRQLGPENTIYPVFDIFKDIVFPTANANLITDRMTIRVVSVDGVAAETASAQKRVSILSEADYSNIASVKANGLDTVNLAMFGIPADPSRATHSEMERRMRRAGPMGTLLLDNVPSTQRTLIIPYGVREPYFDAFGSQGENNVAQVTEIILPESVEVFGRIFGWNRFERSRIRSITIPDSMVNMYVSDEGSSARVPNFTSITMPANFQFDEQFWSNTVRFPSAQFVQFYNNNGKKAGTYTYSNNGLTYSAR